MDFNSISEKSLKAMDKLTKDELIYEIELGRTSRFSRNIPYLKYRLQLIQDSEAGRDREEDVKIAREANYLSNVANELSSGANSLSKWAIGIAIAALLVSIATFVYEVYSSEYPNHSLQPTSALTRLLG